MGKIAKTVLTELVKPNTSNFTVNVYWKNRLIFSIFFENVDLDKITKKQIFAEAKEKFRLLGRWRNNLKFKIVNHGFKKDNF